MSEGRISAIGSQRAALQHLDFLPRAAQDLYVVMTDPERGACISGEGLLIDPVVRDAKDANAPPRRRSQQKSRNEYGHNPETLDQPTRG
jgi:hypothetical protein